jgi:P pilus assembly chaperone PapD
LKSRILSLLLPLICLLFATTAAHAAFTIEPALISFFADKGEKTAFVEIVHTGGGPAAVQLSVHERVLDLDGTLVKSGMPRSSDFAVHPAQVILYPKESANVQIQYKGKGRVTADKAYVLYSQEVPIDLEKDEETGVNTEVKVLTNYYTVISLSVGKPGKLAFVSSKVIGSGKIEVLAENKGAGRVHMERINLVVSGRTVNILTGNSNSIMPGQTRRFTFEWPRAVTEKEVKFVY